MSASVVNRVANVKCLCEIFENNSSTKPVRTPRTAKLTSSRPLPKPAKRGEMDSIVNKNAIIYTNLSSNVETVKPTVIRNNGSKEVVKTQSSQINRNQRIVAVNHNNESTKEITSQWKPTKQNTVQNTLNEQKNVNIDERVVVLPGDESIYEKLVAKTLKSPSPAIRRRQQVNKFAKPELLPRKNVAVNAVIAEKRSVNIIQPKRNNCGSELSSVNSTTVKLQRPNNDRFVAKTVSKEQQLKNVQATPLTIVKQRRAADTIFGSEQRRCDNTECSSQQQRTTNGRLLFKTTEIIENKPKSKQEWTDKYNLQCSSQFERNNTSVSEIRKMFQSAKTANTDAKPPAPSKPPRTFAHDIYVKQKKAQIKPKIPDFEPVKSPNSSLKMRESTLRRSVSMEHIYAEPLPNTRNGVEPKVRASSEVEPYAVTNLFPMTPSNSTPSKPSAVRDIIKHSFGFLRKLTRQKSNDEIDGVIDSDSGSEMSMKEMKERLIYVQTMKKSVQRSASHYYSGTADDSIVLCKCCLIVDNKNEMKVIPSNVEVNNFDQVYQLISIGSKLTEINFFWFTVTTIGGQLMYAYCLRDEHQRVVCLLSSIYFPQLFQLIFKHLFSCKHDIDSKLIEYLRSKCCALPGEQLEFNDQKVDIPFDCQILSNTRPFQLLHSLSPEVLLQSVATLIHERRIVFVSKSIETLFVSTQTVISLIYPFSWDYTYLPLIPTDLITYYAATNIPYVFGVRSEDLATFLKALKKRDDKVLVVDVDSGCIQCSIGDERQIIPSKIYKAVVTALNLSRNMTDPSDSIRDLVVRESFMQMFIELIGSANCFIIDGQFKKNAFISSTRNKSLQMFLHWFCETRIFEAFTKYVTLRQLQHNIQPLFNKQQRMGQFERKTQICIDKCVSEKSGVRRLKLFF